MVRPAEYLQKSNPFDTINPPHTFPQPYPPTVRPESVSFVTYMPLPERVPKSEPQAISDNDLEECIAAFSRLSLAPPSPKRRDSRKPSIVVPSPRPRTPAIQSPKLISRLSPSHPRLVSPALDTFVAVSHKHLSKNTPSHLFPMSTPRAQNIDIPRHNRRKVCSIPYRRPTNNLPTPPESPPSPSFSRVICRTPSLISDHGSEASSPSTPPEFPSIPIPTPTTPRKGTSPEPVSLLDQFLVPQSDWPDIDFGLDVYG